MNRTKFSPANESADGLREALESASVLVTGGSGSFGRAFVERIFDFGQPARVIILSRDEHAQFDMQNSAPFSGRPELRFFIGDVRDLNRLDMAFRDVDYVIHAAALKHVAAAEYNPFECIHTNVMGAENVVQAALRNEVKKVIALSSDKAVNPINLYGASKLASDKIFVAANNLSGSADCRFSAVRYGNVVGSRGSVVPFFKKLVAGGADSLPITDERMTRFWITLPECVDFVLSSLVMMRGGEIFVPKIPSMRIIDLAKTLAPRLSHTVVGIRPGEKLHEVLITGDDARSTVELAGRYVIEPSLALWGREKGMSEDATAVPEGFCYSSDGNTEWMDSDGLKRMLAESGFGT